MKFIISEKGYDLKWIIMYSLLLNVII
jgi:hypothetical protein